MSYIDNTQPTQCTTYTYTYVGSFQKMVGYFQLVESNDNGQIAAAAHLLEHAVRYTYTLSHLTLVNWSIS